MLQPLFERRGLESPSVALTADNLLEFVHSGELTDAGVAVSERSSLQMSAVWRCVSVTAGVSAALPLGTFEPDSKIKVPSPLLRKPHPELTRVELWRLAYTHRLLWGNTYLQKIRSRAGEVKELHPIMPWRVRPARVKISQRNPWGKVFAVTDDTGAEQALTPREILHIPGLSYDGVVGLSPVRHAATAIALSQAAERSGARFFARGAQLSGVLQVEQSLNNTQAEALQSRWEARTGGLENAHKVVVLDNNAKFAPMTMPMRDAQFLETRQFQVPEIARMFGVPLFLLFETQKSTSWGTGLEQQAQGWITFDLHPTWLAPTEQRIEKELFDDADVDRDVRYRLNGLLRGDSAARGQFYRIMREVGGMNADEIRDLEDYPPIPDGKGQAFLSPANMQELGAEPPEPAPQVPPPPIDPADDPQADDEEPPS